MVNPVSEYKEKVCTKSHKYNKIIVTMILQKNNTYVRYIG